MNRAELIKQIQLKQSFLCVGLDPVMEKLPKHLLDTDDPIFEFNKQIIDATEAVTVAYKPNLAFYEALGISGWKSFEKTVEYIGEKAMVIADAKRGDIGNTAKQYAEAFFKHMSCDALTIAPYMGEDSVTPFLSFEGKWAVVLGLTSNKGSDDFQQLAVGDKLLYEQVITKVASWGTPENLMFVIGATHPELFQNVRKLVPEHFFLVPGVGAQGGTVEEVAKNGMNDDVGLLINSSRGIIYAGNDEHFGDAAHAAALTLQRQMATFL